MYSVRSPPGIRSEISWGGSRITPRRGTIFGCVKCFQTTVTWRNVCGIRERLGAEKRAMGYMPLRKICGVKNVLPKACTLSDSLLGCVYEGTFNGSKVRIRRVRTHPTGDPQKLRVHQVAPEMGHCWDRRYRTGSVPAVSAGWGETLWRFTLCK